MSGSISAKCRGASPGQGRIMDMNFSLKSVTAAGVRFGEIQLGAYKAVTPSVFLNTSRLAVPHTTQDRLKKIIIPNGPEVARVAGIQVYADKLFENPKLIKSHIPDVHQFACLRGYPVILGLESGEVIMGNNGSDFVTVNNHSGACKVPIKDYKELAGKLQADAEIVPYERLAASAPPKHLAKALKRNQAYATIYGSSGKPTFVPIYNGDASASKNISFALLVNFDEQSSIDLEAASLRYARGMYNPKQLVQMIKAGVDVFDTSYVDHISDQHKAIMIDFDNLGEYTLLDLGDEEYFEDLTVMDCDCLACTDKVTKSYINHLIKSHEMLATVHLYAHNLHQYLKFFETIRRQ